MLKKISYAVVGLGNIAQNAILPAFAHAKRNSRLGALVSGDPQKLKSLGKQYGVEHTFSYGEYEDCLRSGLIDAVYIATPNWYHQRFTEIAAQHKINVICEKPMALDERACVSMIEATNANQVKLMLAYRLHFDEANLRVRELASTGRLGALHVFNSVFTMKIHDRINLRLQREMGGGTLFDIGIYCIHEARTLFDAEPIEVFAMSGSSGKTSFEEGDEMTSVIMKFPDERLATFTASFGVANTSSYELIGTRGRVRMDHPYEYDRGSELTIQRDDGRITHAKFSKHDQFASELLHFSDCVLHGRDPEPSGTEGLADVRIINALLSSAETGQPVHLGEFMSGYAPTHKKSAREGTKPVADIKTPSSSTRRH